MYIAMNFSASKEQTISLNVNGLTIAHDLEVEEGAAALDGATLILPPYAIVILK